MTKMHELAQLGQSVWLDYMRRSLITSGQLQTLIDQGLLGITSNPTIFEKAIAGSTDYDDDLTRLVEAGKSPEQIYETLALDDIGRAADLLRPAYERTAGADGFISIEANPTLAHDTAGTQAEVRHLFAALDRPNVMVKVPATDEGVPAVETLTAEGININITLIFSLAQYEAVAEAYLRGLEARAAAGAPLSHIASVASFFVSRVDTVVDRALDALGTPAALALRGKIAIANACAAYGRFREIFAGPRWEALAARGARVQRPLWGSTGTKNPLYPDTLYVDALIGPHTVNTVPPATLQAFLDHGVVAPTLEAGVEAACRQLEALAALGVDLDAITRQLLDDGIAAFAQSFESLLASIANKRQQLLAGWRDREARLGLYAGRVETAQKEMAGEKVMERLWARDYTLWKPAPIGISNRLGWLDAPDTMREHCPRLEELVGELRSAGYSSALLLGMGGSSLAPEVFRKTFGVRPGYLDLAVLDSSDPGAVLAQAEALDPAKTLFVVSTKSGDTVETLSLFKFFYNRVAAAVGPASAGAHFIAITDPGSSLVDLSQRLHFRAIVFNDPNIGGRYSALSNFGLLPATLVGADVPRLLDRAQTLAAGCAACTREADNPGAWLGAILAELMKAGRDKATFVLSPAVASFGDWAEQLIAESTGKEKVGILPVVGEPLGRAEVYGADRLFVHVQMRGDEDDEEALRALEAAGHPVVRLQLHDTYDLGRQFLLWEIAVAVAGHRLGINPFDQPNVEAAKVLARRVVADYRESGRLAAGEAAPPDPAVLAKFLSGGRAGDYIALQAYVQPTPLTDAALQTLRVALRDRYRLATTVGYGPRFLHSTGQLHKGDAGRGLFVQITADDRRDAPIPDEAGAPQSSITFGVLKAAQALGDGQALLDAGRRVLRIHAGQDVVAALNHLA